MRIDKPFHDIITPRKLELQASSLLALRPGGVETVGELLEGNKPKETRKLSVRVICSWHSSGPHCIYQRLPREKQGLEATPAQGQAQL